ncbi:unnamed protein product, partial [Nesidiocoris tenuis]
MAVPLNRRSTLSRSRMGREPDYHQNYGYELAKFVKPQVIISHVKVVNSNQTQLRVQTQLRAQTQLRDQSQLRVKLNLGIKVNFETKLNLEIKAKCLNGVPLMFSLTVLILLTLRIPKINFPETSHLFAVFRPCRTEKLPEKNKTENTFLQVSNMSEVL